MAVYTFWEARQKLAHVLNSAETENDIIERRQGESFALSCRRQEKSPFEVPGIEPGKVTTKDIVEAVRFSRSQPPCNR